MAELDETQMRQVADIVSQAIGKVTEKFSEVLTGMMQQRNAASTNQDGQQQEDERAKVRERLAKSISDRMPEMNGIDLEGCSEPVLQYVAKAADLGGKQIFASK